MPKYECAVVLVPSAADEETPKQVETVKGWITAIGGEVSDVDIWGRRRLAYPIQKMQEGMYVLYYFDLEKGNRLPELDRRFNTAEFVLRHLVVRLPALKELPRITAHAGEEEKATEEAAGGEAEAKEPEAAAEPAEAAAEPAEQEVELEAETPAEETPVPSTAEPPPVEPAPAEDSAKESGEQTGEETGESTEPKVEE